MQSKENLMKMFEMHLDGISHAEIAREFGISRQRVHQIVGSRQVKGTPGRPITKCAFPVITKWMAEHNVSVKRMAEYMKCMHIQTLGNKLRGVQPFTLPEIKAILAFTGLTFEEAFGEEIKPDRKED